MTSESFQIEDYRQVYEAVALPVLIIDHESWLILAVNEAALTQYGYEREEFVGLPVLEVRPPEGREEASEIHLPVHRLPRARLEARVRLRT